MADIFINQTRTALDPPPRTLGDLFDILDDRATRQGMLLTSARIDGVDVPAFRDPRVTVTRLATIRRVDVEATTPASMIRQCLLDSVSSLEELQGLVQILAAVYRTGDVTAGHQGLAALTRELGRLTSLMATLEGPLRINLTNVTVRGMRAHQHMDAVGGSLDALAAARKSEDWLAVAYVLEHGLGPGIRSLIGVLSSLNSR
jgi:hypothetical protein